MKTKNTASRERGFTLVEIMISVTIVGLLASMSVPAFSKVRQKSVATTIANDFRIYAAAFEIYALEHGTWPRDVGRQTIPAELNNTQYGNRLLGFSETEHSGAQWDWDEGVGGFTAKVALHVNNLDPDVILEIDEILDDGNLSTGKFQNLSSGASYILEL